MDLSFSTANARYVFGLLDRVSIDTLAFTVVQETELGYLLRRDDTTGLCQQFSFEDLARFGHEGRLRVERDHFDPLAASKRLACSQTSISALTGRPVRRLTKRDLYCQVALELHAEKLLKFTDASITANMPVILQRVVVRAPNDAPVPNREGKINKSENFAKAPSPRTLRRWLAELDKFGLAGHLDKVSDRGIRRSRLTAAECSLMMKSVRKYMSMDKPTIKELFEEMQLEFEAKNMELVEAGKPAMKIPNRETFRLAVRSLDPFQVELKRNGIDAARKKFRPVTTGVIPTRPLERVEIDECTFDAQTVLQCTEIYGLFTEEEKQFMGIQYEEYQDPKTGKIKKRKAARWTLTAAICCATRCIVGMVLSRAPNSEAAVQLLQMIVTNKGAWSDAVGAHTPWDMHGTPELIVFDGGSAFKSLRFRMAAEDMGIAWEMAMNGVPENRGTIERFFGTCSGDLASRLSGHTFRGILQKGDSDPEKRAALNLDDLTFALIRWVVEIYHNTPHGGLDGETPVQAWRRLNKMYGVTPPPDSEMMRLCFGHERDYRLDKTGITVLGVRYQSEVIQHHLRRTDVKPVKVRWHPKDIGAISVKIGEAWFNVPALDTSLKGVPAQTWLTAVRHVRNGAPKSNRLNNAAVRAVILAIKDRNEKAMARAGLNLEDWSEARFLREEKNLLAGVQFYEPETPTKAKGTLGQELPPEDEGADDIHIRVDAHPRGADQTSTSAASSITFEEE
ncbi:transposase [Thioclava sp. SK-1]|uniref:DDE-type integrase/transposase/recombinase n=1 Tax=Thioclava sp. SK-1 TaxID=1889770 RepID=UPI0008258BC5|nr:DDE-type integrase/transposase/recombinase [Thioclava sp. SK-1]OCX57382.1 transposase [Thioclava sp. SK-1]